jgi:hypothetical protein
MRQYLQLTAHNWHDALCDKAFKERLIWGTIGIVIISFCTHYFFDYNEAREGGMVMNDWMLQALPAKNVSLPITFFMLSVVGLFTLRAVVNPIMLSMALIAYTFVLTFRMLTIAITHFEAPPDLIGLQDPVSNLVYGSKSITKDLFFSGHIATVSLVYLCVHKKIDKYYLLFAAISVSMLLLIQHVHYTIDIVCAPFFALGGFWLARKVIHLQYAGVEPK